MATTVKRREGPVLRVPSLVLGPPQPSLLETLLPRATFLHKAVICLALVGMLTALGQGRFYLPEIPVPVTLQTFGVLAVGGIAGWRWGLGTLLVWYFIGMAGAPVFQGGGAGWTYVTSSPTGGYLVGFIAATALVGYLSQRGWHRGRSLWPMLLGNLLLYVPGLLWLGAFGFVPWNEVFSKGMYPFIPGDLVKLMGASLTVGALWALADRRRQRS